MAIVETHALTNIYGEGDVAVTAIDGINLSVEEGEFVAVMGPSGCGKSTLMHLIGGLDQPSSGRVEVDGHELGKLDDDALTQLRRRHLGFVFQFFNLIPIMTAVENAAVPLILDGVGPTQAHDKAITWLKRLGLGERLDHRPGQMSGGQQQRVALARALVADPKLLLCDEPTGNLDSRSADEIVTLLREIVDKWQRSVLMVTHDPRMAAYADRIVFLKDGRVADETSLRGTGTESAHLVRERLEGLS